MTAAIVPGVYRKGHAGFLAPGTDVWSQIITPSKVAAIMGYSRWESAYRLWHRMKGRAEPEAEKDIFRAGHAFELALAELWRGDPGNEGWQLSPGEVQYVGDPEKYGFPFAATIDRRRRCGQFRAVLEMKSARSLEDWGDEFSDAAPYDYVLQVQAQMLFTGLTKIPAHLMVLGPFHKHHTYVIPYSPIIASAIIEACQEFWASLAADEVPPLDESLATYECVRELHPDIDRDVSVSIPADLAAEFHASKDDADAAEKRARAAKTRVLDLMGNAQYADVDGVRVARRQPAKNSIALYAVKPKPPRTPESQTEGAAA